MILYSHQGKPLIKHLEKVANLCKTAISTLYLFSNVPELKSKLINLAHLAGAFHDLGKATKYFQHYLNHQEDEIIGPKNHALISALFVKEISKVYLNSTDLSEFDKELYVCMAFTAVRRHHGKLSNFDDDIKIDIFGNSKSRELKQQIEVFFEPEVDEIISYFTEDLGLKYNFSDFKRYIYSDTFVNELRQFYDRSFKKPKIFQGLPTDKKIEHYYFHQLLYSTLLLSDKSDVIFNANLPGVSGIVDLNAVGRYKTDKKFDFPEPGSINAIKNEAFDQTLSNLKALFNPNQHIYSLTLPTGLGKTITSFAVAQKIRDILGQYGKRLILCMPFTSIIDQSFEVYSEIIKSDNTNKLLKHHHLSEPSYKIDENEYEANKSEFLIETWQSEIVVTTFVQLLDSIFSNDKALLMKLPNLANAMVVLDEVQTIPYHYWQLIKETFEVLGKAYNCYFLLMSATQPLMFIPEKEIIEIVPNYKRYFSYFNRTKIINKTARAVSLADFAGEVCDYLDRNKSKDVLIILNTKKHSKTLFELLRNFISPKNEVIYYLSTLITPFERKEIIELIKKKSGKRKIIVSTQLVEAGVDISVDTVFRSLAPVDAIIQAAGRSNRYNEKPTQGEVYLYEIEELKISSSKIYGVDLITKTKNVLRSVDEIDENAYLQLVENYYKEVRKQSDDYRCKYLDYIQELKFGDMGTFSLIEEKNTQSVYLQLNQHAKILWQQFKLIYDDNSTDLFNKREQFATIKSSFYDYVINVPIPVDKKNIDFDGELYSNFYLSTLENPSRFYKYDEKDFSQNTGYQEVETLSF